MRTFGDRCLPVVVGALFLGGLADARAATTFTAVSDLEVDPTQTALMNARVRDPQDFTSVFFSISGKGLCTAAFVGPKVLMTAAHCVEDEQPVEISRNTSMYTGQCTISPHFSETATADWALCLMESEPDGVLYETVAEVSEEPKEGVPLLLTGLGCTSPNKPPDGVLRIGESTVRATPSGINNTLSTVGGAAVCFRDSGGPAFKMLSAIQINGQTRRARLMVAVASSSGGGNRSNFAAVTTEQASDFLVKWAEKNGASICGRNPNTSGCRPLK